jgi:undecaprenyl-diphosphatase
MSIGEAIILGAVQGISEFLPVSSSGHLTLLKNFFDVSDVPLLFEVMLHIATLLVVVVIFRKSIRKLLSALCRFAVRKSTPSDKPRLRVIAAIFTATLCTVFGALIFRERQVFANPKMVSILFLVTAAILIASRFAKPKRDFKSITVRDGIIVGLAQGVGVLPGISRSGITISACLFAGIKRESAGEFSFLISIPAILGALVLEMGDSSALLSSVGFAAIAAGVITASVVGLFSLLILLKLIKKGRLYLFSIYLIPLGIAGLLFL